MISLAHTTLLEAHKGNYAVGAFNINNMEFAQGIIQAAHDTNAPVIVQTSQGAVSYAGMHLLGQIVHTLAADAGVPVIFHLDHGTDPNLVKEAIQSGLYTSVMIDGSKHDFEENVRITKEIVRLAHKKHIWVEAELGAIPGTEDDLSVADKDAYLTNPEEAATFVKRTGCDALAISIGTKHGVNKSKGKMRLDYKRLEDIKAAVDVPLVLHGASSIPKHLVRIAEDYGADLSRAQGVATAQLKRVVKAGINKVNTDSDLRIAFTGAIDKYMTKDPDNMDPRKYLQAGREAVRKEVMRKIKILGSENKA